MSNVTQGLIRLVQFANRFNTGSSSRQFCKPFFIEDKHVGFIRPDVLQYVKEQSDTFVIHQNSQTGDIIKVQLSLELKTFEERSAKMAEILQGWRKEDDDLITLEGWRDECYNVYWKFSEPPLLKMERSATCLFGVKQFGVHINGYTYRKGEGMYVWIATRSKTKETFPGKLDQMAAGGLASDETIMECAKKECREEASVPDDLMEKIKPAGTVSYFYEDERGLFPECMFVMDLELPEDFKPINADGEAESFQLVHIDKVAALIGSEDFKYNSAIVLLDFMLRRGLIRPDEEPYYSYLMESIHVTLH